MTRSYQSEDNMAYGPEPQEHQVVYTTLHFDTPWSIDSYRQTGG